MFSVPNPEDDDNVDIVIYLGLWKYEKEKIPNIQNSCNNLIDKP